MDICNTQIMSFTKNTQTSSRLLKCEWYNKEKTSTLKKPHMRKKQNNNVHLFFLLIIELLSLLWCVKYFVHQYSDFYLHDGKINGHKIISIHRKCFVCQLFLKFSHLNRSMFTSPMFFLQPLNKVNWSVPPATISSFHQMDFCANGTGFFLFFFGGRVEYGLCLCQTSLFWLRSFIIYLQLFSTIECCWKLQW